MKKYAIYLSFFIACACNQTQKQTAGGIVIDMDRIINIPFDSLKIKSLQYILLETNDDVLITTVSKMLVCGDRIYVGDYDGAKTLFVFDLQGKLIFKIHRVGRGPGEYVQFGDFNVTESGDIYVWDVGQTKLLRYSRDGTFQTERKISCYFLDFMLFPNDRIYVSHPHEHGAYTNNLAYYDWDTGQCHPVIPTPVPNPMLKVQNIFQSPYGCYYMPRFSGTAYRLDAQEVIPYITFKNLPWPSEPTIAAWKKDWREMMTDRTSLRDLISIYETRDYITFAMEFMLPQQMAYQKETGKCFRIGGLQLREQLQLNESLGFFTIRACNEDACFAIIYPNLRGVLNTIRKNAGQMPNKEQLYALNEASNPIIAAFQFEIP